MRRFAPLFVLACAALASTLAHEARAQDAAPAFELHEWGVWVVDAGRVVHLPDLAAGCPSFVMRAPAAQAPRPPRIRRSNVVVEKPVIFFHSDEVIDNVRVRVGFRRGEPWLAWPFARFGRRSVSWRGRIVPEAQGTGLRPVMERSRRHPWWGNLRGAGARFEPRGEHQGEDFLFYDGTLQFTPSFTFQREVSGGPLTVRRTGSEESVWLTNGQTLVRYEAEPGQAARQVSTHQANRAPTILHAELRRRGLTEREASSLVRTWQDDLVPTGARERVSEDVEEVRMPPWRAIYFVPRADYDRMLPLRVRPTPSGIVRVGLVIEVIPD